MGTLPTIKVAHDNKRGWQIINQSKYEAAPADYEVYGEQAGDIRPMTRDELKEALDELGIKYRGNASTVRLLALLRAE